MEEFIEDMARWIAITVHENLEKEGETNDQLFFRRIFMWFDIIGRNSWSNNVDATNTTNILQRL